MERTLIIAEKPSVARDIARVLGATKRHTGYLSNSRYVVSWCIGHLAGLAPPKHYGEAFAQWSLEHLPLLPERFALVPTGDRKQLKCLTDLLTDSSIDKVVNACDAAREGENIFRNVYELSGSQLPIYRLWIASMTDSAIKAGLSSLRPGTDYEPLAAAARSREQADWLVGMNLTRALTLRAREAGAGHRTLYSVGRVQTPTLGLIVSRDLEIEAFVSQPFWKLKASFSASKMVFDGFAIDKERNELRWNAVDSARSILRSIQSAQTAHVDEVETTIRQTQPPLLFDLTSLQREANIRLGFSAQKTLDIAQALYERHKVLTYPRTDSTYITEDLVPTLRTRLEASAAAGCAGLLDEALRSVIAKRVVNDSKVSDHHAILPTEQTVNLGALSKDEVSLYEMVTRRLFANFLPHQVTELVTALITAGPQRFLAKGSRVISAGWHRAEPPRKKKADALLPPLSQGDTVSVASMSLDESQTRPPSRYTEASLLAAMETAGKHVDDPEAAEALKSSGLGTPATRASMIEKLILRGYVAREKKSLISTPLGRELISLIPTATLKSAELTGQWEAGLNLIAKKQFSAHKFMAQVRQLTEHACSQLGSATLTVEAGKQDELGACPICKAPVVEWRKGYSCSVKDCSFIIWKTVAGKRLSKTVAKQLLAQGKTAEIKGFKSKKNKKFSAYLYLDSHYAVTFAFDPKDIPGAQR